VIHEEVCSMASWRICGTYIMQDIMGSMFLKHSKWLPSHPFGSDHKTNGTI
jgi:hypothetical protein